MKTRDLFTCLFIIDGDFSQGLSREYKSLKYALKFIERQMKISENAKHKITLALLYKNNDIFMTWEA